MGFSLRCPHARWFSVRSTQSSLHDMPSDPGDGDNCICRRTRRYAALLRYATDGSHRCRMLRCDTRWTTCGVRDNESTSSFSLTCSLLSCSHVDDTRAVLITAQLRLDKATGNRRRAGVLEHMEIVLIPKEVHGQYTLYPGLFLFSTPARMVRPVMNLISKTTEYVGTLEQVYLGICITHDEFVPGVRVSSARSRR